MSRATKGLRIAGKIIKLAFVLLIVFINLFLLWRLFSTSNPSSMDRLSPNENLVEAYKKDPALSGTFRQEQRSITSGESNYGYFSVTKATFIPAANQIQIVVRYNNSTLRHTEEDFSLDAAPDRDSDVYDVSLLLVTDLTPDDESDNLTTAEGSTEELRIHPTYSQSDKKTLYNYRLFVFDLGELDLSEHLEKDTLLAVYADIYYNGAIDYDKTPYGTLCLYDYITETIDVKLSSAEKKSFEDWTKNR